MADLHNALDAAKKALGLALPQRGVRRLAIIALAFAALLASFLVVRTYPTSAGARPHSIASMLGFGGASGEKVWRTPKKPSDNRRYSATVVAGVQKSNLDEASWLDKVDNLQRKAIYVVDDPTAPLHLDQNHGRESMVYLEYIISHFDNLTDVTFFFHAHADAWHNNALLRRDSATTLNLFRRAAVMKRGYANSRCDLHPGCPRWIEFDPTQDEVQSRVLRWLDMFSKETWLKLFPDTREFPRYLSAPCCSQFAVSRDAIRAVPLETYERVRAWIREEDLDGLSGRVMEYTWHYLFTGHEELCPDIATCYCELYGLCDLDDELLLRWQSYVQRANDLDERTHQCRGRLERLKPSVPFEKDDEYRSIREKAEAMAKGAREYGDLVFDQSGIGPIEQQ